jgi:altronate dehydratase
VSEIVLFQLDFCANITISKSMFTQIDINAGQLMSTFQTDVHIDQTSFIGIIYDVAGNSSAF